MTRIDRGDIHDAQVDRSHSFPCLDPDCESCELQAERHADRVAEARADDAVDRYERYCDDLGPIS